MTNRENKSNFIDIIVYAMMFVAVIYIVIQTLLNNNGETSFKITLGLWLLGAIVISDFVEPLICEDFNNMMKKEAMFFGLYAVADAVAYVSLYIFIINIGYTKEPIHIVFLGIAGLFFGLRILFSYLYKKSKKDVLPADTQPVKEVLPDDNDDVEINTLTEEDEDDIKVMVYRSRNN